MRDPGQLELEFGNGPLRQNDSFAVWRGFNPKQVAFITAFSDRRSPAYRKLASELSGFFCLVRFRAGQNCDLEAWR